MSYFQSNSAKMTLSNTLGGSFWRHVCTDFKFLLCLKQDHLRHQTIKVLGPTPPFLYFKKCHISSQVQQKRPSQTPAVAPFRDTYVPTSKKYVSTEPKTRSFQWWNYQILGPTPPFLYFKNCDISSHIQQTRHSQTPTVATFTDTYAPISKKYISTNAKTISLT